MCECVGVCVWGGCVGRRMWVVGSFMFEHEKCRSLSKMSVQHLMIGACAGSS